MIRVTTIVSSPGHGGCKHSLSIQPGLIQQRSLGPKASASNVFVSRQASAAGGLLCRGTNRLRWVAEASVSSPRWRSGAGYFKPFVEGGSLPIGP